MEKPVNFFDAVPPLTAPSHLKASLPTIDPDYISSVHELDSGGNVRSYHSMIKASSTFEDGKTKTTVETLLEYAAEQGQTVERAVESNQEFLHEEIPEETPEEVSAHEYDDD